jgi:hypothetical protein
MEAIVIRVRAVVRSLGNAGALANAHGELVRTATAHAAIDRLEQRLAAASPRPVTLPDAA